MAPSQPAPHWSRSIGTGGRDPSEWVVGIIGMRTDISHGDLRPASPAPRSQTCSLKPISADDSGCTLAAPEREANRNLPLAPTRHDAIVAREYTSLLPICSLY